MRVGSLFTGIGGFDLGLTQAGHEVIWQVEIDEWCRKVLAKHWPDATRFADIRDCGAHNLEHVDIICGGFPCTDISMAGKQEGIDGEQSGLWREMLRITGEIRPQYIIMENVPGLLVRGFDRILGALAEIGYDAEWDIISAADVGAPHKRERLWVVAYPNRVRKLQQEGPKPKIGRWTGNGSKEKTMAHTLRPRLERHAGNGERNNQWKWNEKKEDGYIAQESLRACTHEGWDIEPQLGRMADGIPDRIHRLRGLGNAIVPKIAYLIGERLASLITCPSEHPAKNPYNE
jgi:DNA (cytosine-5)-methyltransferase 1